MANEKSRFFRGLEALQIIVQIIAIFVAGFWTYLKFIRTEAPLFENSARVSRSLNAPAEQGGACLRSFNVTFENTGKSVFTVKRVLTRVWKFSLQRDKDVTLVDLDKIEAEEPVFKKEFPDPALNDNTRPAPFLKRYRPGEVYSHDFQFLFKRKEGEAWIFVKTEIFLDGEAKPHVAGAWDPICG